MKNSILSICLVILVFTLLNSQDYKAVPIFHPDGQFIASGINDQGQISGFVLPDGGVSHALIREPDGGYTNLVELGGSTSQASGINNLGAVIGSSNDESGLRHILIWENANNFRMLATPENASFVLPRDINNKGEGVGYYFDASFNTHAVFWDSDGNVVDLPEPENQSTANSLNDHGEIAGNTTDSDGNSRPILWRPTDSRVQEFEVVELGSFGGSTGRATAINNFSQAVGLSSINDSISHAFLWENNQITDLQTLGGNNSVAHAINDSVLIVGASQSEGVVEAAGKMLFMESKLFEIAVENQLLPYEAMRQFNVNRFSRQQEEERATGWSGKDEPFDFNDRVIDTIALLNEASEVNNLGMVVGLSFTNTVYYYLIPIYLVDTDMDGLPDIAETNTGVYIDNTNTGSDPLNEDTDGDGLLDGEEVEMYGTDPNLADTDGDGLNDRDEILNGQNPNVKDVVDLEVVKTGPSAVKSGEQLIYEIEVTNKGDSEEINTDAPNVVINESLPEGTTYVPTPGNENCAVDAVTGQLVCQIGELKSGETKKISITVSVQAPVGEQLRNGVNVIAPGFYDPALLGNSDAATTRVVKGIADLKIEMKAPGAVRQGGNIAYNFLITNNGPDPANVTIKDVLPDGVTYERSTGNCLVSGNTVACEATVPAKGNIIFGILCRVDSMLPVGSTLSNSVSIELPNDIFDPDKSNNQSGPLISSVLPGKLVTKVADPDTRFHRLIITGKDDEWSWEPSSRKDDRDELVGDLFTTTNQDTGGTFLELYRPSRAQMQAAIDSLKKVAQPGEEVTLFYLGHGTYGITGDWRGLRSGVPVDIDGDEPAGSGLGGDETIWINDSTDVTDDELAVMIQGFNPDVTKVIILGACYGGGFTDGTSDIQESDNCTVIGISDWQLIDPWIFFGAFYSTLIEDVADGAGEGDADANGDGVVTADELKTWLRDERDWNIGPPKRQQKSFNIPGLDKFKSGKSYYGGANFPPGTFLPTTVLDVTMDTDDSSKIRIQIDGHNFVPNKSIKVELIDENLNNFPLGISQTDSSGMFNTDVEISPSIPRDGFYLLLIYDSEGYNDWWPIFNGTYRINSHADNGDLYPGDGVCEDDLGNCTLRAAIEESNTLPGIPTIDLSNLTSTSRKAITIRPQRPLPVITDPVIINGAQVQLDGSDAGNGANGLVISAGNSMVNDLVITNFNGNGILLKDQGNNIIRNTTIGTDENSSTGLGNSGTGIFIENSSSNLIGGTEATQGNTIAFNGNSGVIVDGGIANTIQWNSMYSNNGPGIDLGNDGMTPNDPEDVDQGANNLQNYPEISDAVKSGSELIITYKITSSSTNSAYPIVVEFFEADEDKQEGQTFLRKDTLTIDQANMEKTITLVLSDSIDESTSIVATATDSDGNTSEFSPAVELMTTDVPLVSNGFFEMQSNPNPFSQATEISYYLPSNASVRIEILDLLGRKVRTLVDAVQLEGFHTVNWDGTSDSKYRATSGIYLCRLEARVNSEVFIDTKKLVLQ